MFKKLPLVICIMLVAGCATVPITGRKQISFLPASQLASLSQESYSQIISESKLSQDREKIQVLERVGKRIAESAEEFMIKEGMGDQVKSYDWEFNLIEDDDTVNAFAMAGGKIAVYTGILKVTKDDSGLATVLSHEIAHVIANHAGERMSQYMLAEFGNVLLSEALKEQPDKTRNISMLAYGLGANVGVLLPFSRTHEQEADHIGLIIMALAGYDPNLAIDFWQRMSQESKNRPLEFLSTHPSAEKRIENLRRELPEAMEYYK
ncbi:MAG: M48 family metallopeptidase [Candidatus Omnitrophica bacterium]|nr:M48 family metallopeptidase [Candidatus Omnitrophota bacterium]